MQLNTGAVDKNTQLLNSIFSKDFGTLINPVHFSIQTSQYNLMVPTKVEHGQTKYSVTQDVISFVSAPAMSSGPSTSHCYTVGYQTSTSAIEIALTAESAAQLHVDVGFDIGYSDVILALTDNPIE